MPEEKEHIEWVKALGPYAVALLALAGVFMNTVVSSNNLKTVVARIDDKIIPALEEKVDELTIKIAKLEEHNNTIEKMLREFSPVHKFMDSPPSKYTSVLGSMAIRRPPSFVLPKVAPVPNSAAKGD